MSIGQASVLAVSLDGEAAELRLEIHFDIYIYINRPGEARGYFTNTIVTKVRMIF